MHSSRFPLIYFSLLLCSAILKSTSAQDTESKVQKLRATHFLMITLSGPFLMVVGGGGGVEVVSLHPDQYPVPDCMLNLAEFPYEFANAAGATLGPGVASSVSSFFRAFFKALNRRPDSDNMRGLPLLRKRRRGRADRALPRVQLRRRHVESVRIDAGAENGNR